MNTVAPFSHETSSRDKTKKKIKDTVLAEGIELIYKTLTFLLIKWRGSSSQVSSEQKQPKQIGFKILSYLIHIILILNSMRIWCIFMNKDVRREENLLFALVMAFYVSFIGFVILHRLLCFKDFIKLRNRLLDLELYSNDENKLIRMNKKIKPLIFFQLISGIILTIIAWTILIILPEKNSPIRIYTSYPITNESQAYFIASALFIFLCGISGTWGNCMVGITVWLLLFIRKKFDCLADQFRRNFPRGNVTSKSNVSSAEKSAQIYEIYEAHDNLCGVLESVNICCRDYFGFLYSFEIAEICILTYGLIHDLLDTFEIFYLSWVVVFQTIGVSYMMIKSIQLKSSAHQLTDDLYAIDLRNLSSEASLKVSIFLTRLTSSPIGISVAGLFVIDHSTILMLTGTLLTYIIVVIQTKAPECQCERQNITNITMREI